MAALAAPDLVVAELVVPAVVAGGAVPAELVDAGRARGRGGDAVPAPVACLVAMRCRRRWRTWWSPRSSCPRWWRCWSAGGPSCPRWRRWREAEVPSSPLVVVAELAPLDLDVLAALVAIALVAAMVAELEPQHARHRRLSSTRRPGGGPARGLVAGELAAELVAAPLDLDVLAALVAIALVAAMVAELEPHLDVLLVAVVTELAAELDLDVLASWSPSRCSPR
jgi:hypothetical protein